MAKAKATKTVRFEQCQLKQSAAEAASTGHAPSTPPAEGRGVFHAAVAAARGYNHSPTRAGRVTAAAKAGDILALMQTLDDGCSTQEINGVSFYCKQTV
jgi:hypothetical protein